MANTKKKKVSSVALISQHAKKIRKPKESWQSAISRATKELKAKS